MAWIDGKLQCLEPYYNGPKYKKELNDTKKEIKRTEEVMRRLNSDNTSLRSYNNSANKKISLLEIEAQQVLPSIKDALYWNTKFPQRKIRYPKVDVQTHLKFREIEGVTKIARDIMEMHHFTDLDEVANSWNKWVVTNVETQTRRSVSTKKPFVYKTEVKETWRTPEQTLFLGYGDCDDYMLLGYFVIRKMLMLLNEWEYHSHRLLCQVVFAFYGSNKLPRPAGWHANLLWIHSDLNYYTLETTFYASKALTHFGKLPQKYNPMYPLIDFTFTSEFAFSFHDLERDSYDYKKKLK